MNRQHILSLRSGPMSLGIIPKLGGSVAWFRDGERDLMRPMTSAALEAEDVLGVAMFPMIPFANRIADNRFSWDGRDYRFEPNCDGLPLHIHGTAWQKPWQVKDAGGQRALLTLDHIEPQSPYSYRATQHFDLSADMLEVTLSLTNAGDVPMPCGFGLHPWFPRTEDMCVQFSAREIWLEDPDGVPSEPIAIPATMDYANGALLPRVWRNNDYAGWSGQAAFASESAQVKLSIDADPIFGHLMVYANPKLDVFCLEPQTHLPAAFCKPQHGSKAELGINIVAPGKTIRGSVRFRSSPSAP